MRRSDPGLDAAAEQVVLAVDGRLEDLAFGPEDALVAFPALAVADQARRQAADATVQ
jgi:hypothetical protein